MALLFRSHLPQLCHNLGLPLPLLPLQEVEGLWWRGIRGLVPLGVTATAATTATAAAAAPPALAGSSTGALADDLVEGQVYVRWRRRGPELLLAFLELLQLPPQQRVLQLDL